MLKVIRISISVISVLACALRVECDAGHCMQQEISINN